MDSHQRQNQTLEDWYAQNTKLGYVKRLPELLYSEVAAVNTETITDKGFFIMFLKPEESKSGQLEVAVCKETAVYVREENGDPGKLLHSKMEVISTVR